MKKLFKGFNYFPEIIILSIYFKCRFSLSYRDIEEISKLEGLDIDHVTLERWVSKFIPYFEKSFRKHQQISTLDVS